MAGRTMAGAIPLIVGANQRSSSLAVRDRLYVEEHAHRPFLERLQRAGITQALLVSTCDRVEVHAMHPDPEAAGRKIAAIMARHGGYEPNEVADQLYTIIGEAALRHLFAVAASLESTVVGEPHVLGQMKESHRASQAAGLTGSELEAAVQCAFAVAKRVRTETAIGEGPVSVAAAAIDVARGVHGDLERLSCLMIGTGEMGELLAEALREAGLGRLFVTDTRASRAEAAARALDCHTLPLEDLADAAGKADIVLGCLGSRTPVVSTELARAALRKRRNRPIVFVDTAVPGDIDPLADRLDGVFLYTLDDLERLARNGRKAREGEVETARRIVDEEVTAFLLARAERAAVPALTRLRSRFESARAQALADAGGDAEKATRLLVNRLLHDPITRLREIAGRGDDADRELSRFDDMLKRLFDLGDEDTEHKR
jgi:glutamyl-tRNA reductase